MAYEYRIEPAEGLGIITLTGRVNGPQIREAMEALFGDARWQPGFASLWDAVMVEAIAIAPEDLPAISETMEQARLRAGAGRGAWVVRGEMAQSIGELLARRAQQRGHERRCFTDTDEARRWLRDSPSSKGARS